MIEYPFGTTEADAVINELASSWRAATGPTPPGRWGFRVGGVPLVIESADPDLIDRLRPALSHHQRLGANDDAVVVRVWSLDAPGSVRPAMPPALVQRRDTHVRRPDGSQVRAMFDPANRVLMAWDSAPGPGCPNGVAWWCLESVDNLQWWEQAAPLRPVLSWVLPGLGRHLAHCAAVGDSTGAIVLCGPGGSGKSTTALGCHLDGMGYVGDDYCLITHETTGRTAAGMAPRVHSLFATAKVRVGEQLESGPLAAHMLRATPPAGGKAVAVVTDRPGAHVVHEAPVAVVAAVSVGHDDRTRVYDATRAEVLAALAPSSLQQLPGVTAASFEALAELVRSVPVCRIELGHNRAGVIDVVRAVVADPTVRRS